MAERMEKNVRNRSRIAVLTIAASIAAAIFLSVPATGAEGGAVTVTGAVTRVQATERTVTVSLSEGGEARFVWNNDTRITGVLTPGARVTVRYVAGDGGQNRALQITVSRS